MPTPKMERPNDSDPVGRNYSGPQVHNMVSGFAGAIVQAGVVHGDVHLHAPSQPSSVVPRQVPAVPDVFAGRIPELAELDSVLTASSSDTQDTTGSDASEGSADSATVVISAIGGAGGIGKTWLAIRWANAHAERFPDGQLFVDLRGFSQEGEPMEPGTAVRGFLDALGVEPSRVPRDLEAQAALYRSLVAERRMLIVLDNAATAEQVTPLLPGGRFCTVLITSRRVLSRLITRQGARHLSLDVLNDAEAYTLLQRRLGSARLAAEPRAVAELLSLCRGFPLALGILAGRAHTFRQVPLAQLATELRESGVIALDDDDPAASLPAVLAISHRALTAEQQLVFGLLGIAPGPDIGLHAAVSLTGLPPARTGRVLRALLEASLLHHNASGRYTMHDLIRAYAATTAVSDEPRDAAMRRVVDFYLHTAYAAARFLFRYRTPIQLDPLAPGVRPHPQPNAQAALDWLETEHSCLLAVQHTAAAQHHHQAVWQLAWTLHTFHWRRGHRHDELVMWQVAIDTVGYLLDLTTRGLVHRYLGFACAELNRHDEAEAHLREAIALIENDPVEQAHNHRISAWVWERRGDHRQAWEHSRRARELFRSVNSAVYEAEALYMVGWHAAHLGDYDAALADCQEALAQHRHHNNPDGEIGALKSLGYIAHHTGHHRQAVEYCRQALALCRVLGHVAATADLLDQLGHPHIALDERDQVREVWLAALRLYREQGRDTEAERVQRKLDNLDQMDTDQPCHGIGPGSTGW